MGALAPDVGFLVFLQVQKYLNAACVAIWIYEYVRSIGLEVTLIWKAPWNIPKLLYLLARYLTLLVLILLNYYNQTDCVAYQKLLAWGVNVLMCVSEVIFALRTWAIWDRTRKMAIFLSSFFLVIWISTFVIIGLWTTRPVSPQPPAPQDLSTCRDIYSQREQRLFRDINFALIVVFYAVTLTLTSIKAYQYFVGNVKVGFLRIVHFDGVLYYAFLFAVSLKILILNLVAGTLISHAGVLSGLQPTVCALMACRMLLHLRQQGNRNVRVGSQAYTAGFTVHLDTLVFAHADMDPETNDDEEREAVLPSSYSRS